MEIEFYIVIEKHGKGIMKLLPVKSKNQLADFISKALHTEPFNEILSKLKMVDIYQPSTCGGMLNHASKKGLESRKDQKEVNNMEII